MKIGELLKDLLYHTHVEIEKDGKEFLSLNADNTDAVELVKDLEVKNWYPEVESTIPSITIILPDTVVEETEDTTTEDPTEDTTPEEPDNSNNGGETE